MLNRFTVFATMLCAAAALLSTPNLQAQKSEVKNVVLVHGAWADGSGWSGVYDNLVRDGFNVSVVQEPETSFQAGVRQNSSMIFISTTSTAHDLTRRETKQVEFLQTSSD
jgi:hypothetical protein